MHRKTASWHNDSVALVKSCQILLLIKSWWPRSRLRTDSFTWPRWYRLFHVLNLDSLDADHRSEPERSQACLQRAPICSKFSTYLFGQDMVSRCNLTSNLIRDIYDINCQEPWKWEPNAPYNVVYTMETFQRASLEDRWLNARTPELTGTYLSGTFNLRCLGVDGQS